MVSVWLKIDLYNGYTKLRAKNNQYSLLKHNSKPDIMVAYT